MQPRLRLPSAMRLPLLLQAQPLLIPLTRTSSLPPRPSPSPSQLPSRSVLLRLPVPKMQSLWRRNTFMAAALRRTAIAA
jgi:hypothetical protein